MNNIQNSNSDVSAENGTKPHVSGILKRTIKFRFWLGHTKKMTYEHTLIEISNAHWDFTEDIIPLQFTGLQDSKGTDIYDGDIIKSWYSRDMSGKDIVHTQETVEYEIKQYSGEAGYEIAFLERSEVIGNVFENPELLG